MNKDTKTDNYLSTVTSTNQIESTVIDRPVGEVWETFKDISNLAKILPSAVKRVSFTNGSESQVGSIFEVEYKDGAVWTYRIVELSDLKRTFSYELIAASPEITFSSLLKRIRIYRVSDDNRTFIRWETNYSSDVVSSIVQDGRYKKLEYFKDMKKYFENCGKK